jgi:hypothetical protein
MMKIQKLFCVTLLLTMVMAIGCVHRISGTSLKVYAEPADPPCVKKEYFSKECDAMTMQVLFVKWKRLAQKYRKQVEIYSAAP